MRSPVGQFTASTCHFVDWDNHNEGSPAIQIDAGKAIVQACTFMHEGTHVQVGKEVRSALLSTNQADGGFSVENHAGKRVQTSANEVNPLDATPEARSHYQLHIGGNGDGTFVRAWHGRERFGEGPTARTMRWSTPNSKLVLPVIAGKPYEFTMELNVPQQAVSPDAGLYLDGKLIAPIQETTTTLRVSLPPTISDKIALELRCRGWVPKETMAGSKDDRTLGVSVYSVSMKAADATGRAFNVNSGE
jgi:hypothetical protein